MAGGTPGEAGALDRFSDGALDYPLVDQVAPENEQVRVLRISYGPGEKSVMHEHPANVAVFLTDGQTKFPLADGTSQEVPAKAGMTVWDAGGKHLPANVGDKPFELILVELKSKAAPAMEQPERFLEALRAASRM